MMTAPERRFWWWASVLLIGAAVAGVFFPRACLPVLFAQFVLGLFIGVFVLLWPPNGPDALCMSKGGF